MIADRLQALLKRIPDHVELLAAVKTRTGDEILDAIRAGAGLLGSNYAQEGISQMREVIPQLEQPVRWNFIGRLQSNKLRGIVQHFDEIETLAEQKHAARLQNLGLELNRRIQVLLEINVAGEANKSGIWPGNTETFLEQLQDYDHLQVNGLMTMGPVTPKPEDLRPWFRQVRRLLESLNQKGYNLNTLSMGMSASWPVAVAEGATRIRIGTDIFGPRPAPAQKDNMP